MSQPDSARVPAGDARLDRAASGAAAFIVPALADCEATACSATKLIQRLHRDVAAIDAVINEQVNAILHHPAFQELEARWRGLALLASRVPGTTKQEKTKREEPDAPSIKLKVLDLRWDELARDLDRAIEFDQSEFFRKIYESEFGSPGGEPFGVLIADYEIHPTPGEEDRYDHLDVLQGVAGVAAAAFCPFIANASPRMFGLRSDEKDEDESVQYEEEGRRTDFIGLERKMDHATYLRRHPKWQALREQEDARFIGLALPRVLMRRPYGPDRGRGDRFSFHEEVAGRDGHKFLWAGAAFALGAVILRAFDDAAWPADIRGVQRGVDAGGLVSGLAVDEPGTDSARVALKSTTDVVITDELEKELGELGFIPLCACHDAPYAAFYSLPSVQRPRTVERADVTMNARLSSMIPYMLCVSRFAHYVKVMARDRIGSVSSADELERMLQVFLTRYVALDDEAAARTKARLPLREAKVQLQPKPGDAGAYRCVIHLVPHYELDDMAVKVRLTTELRSPRLR